MIADGGWAQTAIGLEERGWRARSVPVERLDDLRQQVAGVIATADIPPVFLNDLGGWTHFTLPATLPDVRSVIVGAARRPATQAGLLVGGRRHTVVVPPHYANGYHVVPPLFEQAVSAVLASSGHRAVSFEPPLKALAAHTGLARYGRTNVVYVDGFGSYVLLAACVSDAPPPLDAAWQEPRLLDDCRDCDACRAACPSGAIAGDRFLLHGERCLTYVNEDDLPFPSWVRPEWHTCAVGCLRCQLACPANARAELLVDPPQVFDEAESAALLEGADPATLSTETRRKMARCGLDYLAAPMARNMTELIEGGS